ncbi:EamA-like transporter family [Raoultella terrigena]|uniref:EamA-like transporter family n=1 Tax=Raoultella terrigena TaxID=577 RepID=A0A4U9CZX3_RAOTE|nr:EamA-like transporter family [Raoultella terrigena]
MFCFNFWCFYTAAAHINTGLESVIFSMAVLFNAINGFIFFRQQPPGRFWFAAALGLAGIRDAVLGRSAAKTGLNASLLWGIGLSALGNLRLFAGEYASASATSAGVWNADHQQLGDALRNSGDGRHRPDRGDDFSPQWTLSYMGRAALSGPFGSVIAFGAYFTLVGRIGASKAAYSTLLFPLVALTISTFYEGYVWHGNAIAGLAFDSGG